jgi:hypothetical protein
MVRRSMGTAIRYELRLPRWVKQELPAADF